MLQGSLFRDVNEGIVQVLQAIILVTPMRAFDEWKNRLAQCITRDGKHIQISSSKVAEACSGKK
jgi:hypothetical protein